mmetsp:Transcript_32737/g.76117  ORF Transcript_32737/g.76117 Transcript_32737/m.76117 type:complete len:172 (+) Transcript_32737:69-584(+)
MRHLRVLLVAAALLYCTRSQEESGDVPEEEMNLQVESHQPEDEDGPDEGGLEEQDLGSEDLELPEDEEEEEGEEEHGMNGALLQHELGEACLKKAEEAEREIGLFDEADMDASRRNSLARRLAAHAEALLGRSQPDFQNAMHNKLAKVHSEGGSFGAGDACTFLLRHHGEL